jgi:hypothetical protein
MKEERAILGCFLTATPSLVWWVSREIDDAVQDHTPLSSGILSQPPQTDCPGRPVAFARADRADLDVTILNQLPSAQLPLDDHLEPGALEMESLDAPLGGRALIE